MIYRTTFTAVFLSALMALGPANSADVPAPAPAYPQEATIQLDIGKITFLVGGSGGFGQLNFEGQAYPLAIGGVNAGATISFSRADLVGTVYNLTQPSDIEGIYAAGTAGIAAAAGGAVITLTNSRGVTLALSGKQLGLDASLDLSGMRITVQ